MQLLLLYRRIVFVEAAVRGEVEGGVRFGVPIVVHPEGVVVEFGAEVEVGEEGERAPGYPVAVAEGGGGRVERGAVGRVEGGGVEYERRRRRWEAVRGSDGGIVEAVSIPNVGVSRYSIPMFFCDS